MDRKSIYYFIWVATAISLFVFFYGLRSFRVWHWLSEEKNHVLLFCLFFVLTNSLTQLIFKMLRLSLEGKTVENIPISLEQNDARVPEEVIEIWKPEPLGDAAYVFAAFFGYLGLLALVALWLPGAFVCFVIAVGWIFIVRLGRKKPTLRVTTSGIHSLRDSGDLWSKYVRWNQVARCDIVTVFNIWGDADPYLSFKNASGKQILSAHLKEATEEEKERLFCFIRQNIR